MGKSKIVSNRVKRFRKYMTITVGAILMAISVNMVYAPVGLVTGGVAGLGIVVKEITSTILPTGLPIWLFTVICNIPLFLVAARLKGKKFMISVLVGTLAYILALMVIPIYDFEFNDALLSSIVGGTIGGVGIGLVFSSLSSTGGTDLLATLVHDHKKHLSVPQVLIVIDGVIIIIGAFVFGITNALYAIIAVFINTKVSDGILEGLKFAKMAYIISDEYKKIAEAILHLDRGATCINATGMYSDKERKMLFCVVSRRQIVKIIEISNKIDPKCFIIVSDVREVMGEGFIEYRQ